MVSAETWEQERVRLDALLHEPPKQLHKQLHKSLREKIGARLADLDAFLAIAEAGSIQESERRELEKELRRIKRIAEHHAGGRQKRKTVVSETCNELEATKRAILRLREIDPIGLRITFVDGVGIEQAREEPPKLYEHILFRIADDGARLGRLRDELEWLLGVVEQAHEETPERLKNLPELQAPNSQPRDREIADSIFNYWRYGLKREFPLSTSEKNKPVNFGLAIYQHWLREPIEEKLSKGQKERDERRVMLDWLTDARKRWKAEKARWVEMSGDPDAEPEPMPMLYRMRDRLKKRGLPVLDED